MYLSNEGLRVEADKNFNIMVKTDKVSVDDWRVLLINKNSVDVKEMETVSTEYLIFQDDNSQASEDTNSGEYSLKVKDASIYNIGEHIKILNNYYIIKDINADDNILYFTYALKEDVKTDDDIMRIKYPNLIGDYLITCNITVPGNYILNIGSKKAKTKTNVNVDVLASFTSNISSDRELKTY